MESAGALITTSLTSHYAQSNLVMLFGKLGFSRVFFLELNFHLKRDLKYFFGEKQENRRTAMGNAWKTNIQN